MSSPDPLLLGIRHHGPGSARAVRAVLEAHRPAAVLVEGPPEGDALLGHAAEEGMRPPVALLAYAVDDPGRAAFWPLAEFSPEWVAIRWAAAHGVPVRFIDLPAAHSPALTGHGGGAGQEGGEPEDPNGRDRAGTGGDRDVENEDVGQGDVEKPDRGQGDAAGDPGREAPSDGAADPARLRVDPLAALAEAAGYDDPERWWEDVVEHRRAAGGATPGGDPAAGADPYAPFAALAEAMAVLRADRGDGGHPRDAVREAHMRLRLREERRKHTGSVAVVCGAWHVPALAEKRTVTADRQLLKGLPKVKVGITWVPWTHRRLARQSGYGAGITSPGWYGHLFAVPDRPVERWMTTVAGLLRDEGHPVSSAHVIEAVRLAETLAALRGRPLAGLAETTDAVRSVLCEGSEVPLALVQDRLVVGDVLGEVPRSAPAVPLQRDLERLQRRLRLQPQAAERELELDLRKDNDAARSRLLHRLALLGVGWGEPARSRGSTGTFRETWRLRWQPELAVQVAEAGVWGTTVLSAATAKACFEAESSGILVEITALAERCLLAELPEAVPVVMRALADRAALDTDVGHLAEALPALVRTARYGNVRGTDSAALGEVAEGLAERVCVGLPPACTGLDADGAAQISRQIEAVHRAIGLLADGQTGLRGRWSAVLCSLAARDRVPGLVRGRCARLLLDDGQLDGAEAARLMARALSPGTGPAEAAWWIEGFLTGSGMLLLHDEQLLALVDAWLTAVPDDAFTDVLPLLRRTFASYEPGVRRSVGELVRRGPGRGAATADAGHRPDDFAEEADRARADAALPVLRQLLGIEAVARAARCRSNGTAHHDAEREGDSMHAVTGGSRFGSEVVTGPVRQPAEVAR